MQIVIIIILSFLLSMSVLMETIGVWSRAIGAYNLEPTTGYSTHVRVATMGRFFILLSAPSLGYLVDHGVNSNEIALIGFFTFLIILIFIIIFTKYGIFYFHILYGILNKKKVASIIPKNDLKKTKLTPKFFLLVLFSFIMTATGVIIVNYLATIFVENPSLT